MCYENKNKILLNYFCNRHFPALPPETCCGATRPSVKAAITPIMGGLGAMSLLLLLLAVSALKKRMTTNCPTPQASDGSMDQETEAGKLCECVNGRLAKFLHLCWCFLKLAGILIYFILCDRVKVFALESKHYSATTFFSPLCAALAVAIASRRTLVKSDLEEPLNRDVTDEWKGWMQLVLLVYHMTGAYHHLSLYVPVRLIVSSYLFLMGYEHFTRFLKTGQSGGFSKYFQTMFRLNFLTALLCQVMNQPYLNYYFIPLMSFWFTALHLVLSQPPGIDGQVPDKRRITLGCGALRIGLLAALVAVLSYSEPVFRSLFGTWPLQTLFRLPEGGVREWRFRWTLDRFSTLYGMMFAWVCHAYNSETAGETSSVWPKTSPPTILLGLASSICLGSYSALLQFCNGKVSCNAWHPYLAWIPITSYVVFRHHNALFRNTFSPWLAWLGRISLELFVSQYHVFLANNTHAVLVLVPGQPLANALVSGLVLLCVADELNLITNSARRALLPTDAKRLAAGAVLIIFSVLGFVYNRKSLEALQNYSLVDINEELIMSDVEYNF